MPAWHHAPPGRTELSTIAPGISIEPRLARSACVALNELPERERRAFHAVIVDGAMVDEHAARIGRPRAEVARDLERTLRRIGAPGSPEEGREDG